jgi:hypothetical protein
MPGTGSQGEAGVSLELSRTNPATDAGQESMNRLPDVPRVSYSLTKRRLKSLDFARLLECNGNINPKQVPPVVPSSRLRGRDRTIRDAAVEPDDTHL